MDQGRLVIISGGARSGKSSFAQDLAFQLKGEEVTYLATGEARDDEMKKRIAIHKRNRPRSWQTVEEPLAILPVIQREMQKGQLILLDCLTLWLSNVLLRDEEKGEEAITSFILKVLQEVVSFQREEKGELILVSNEVGMGIVPETPLGRIFRDMNGRMNTFLAREADTLYVTFLGIPLRLKEKGVLNW